MSIKIFKSKKKNMYGEYSGQIDYNETQIQVISNSKAEVSRIIKQAKKIIKPLK